jgi:hypothetical protein
VLKPSRSTSLDTGVKALGTTGGQLIAVLGSLTAGQARELAQARRGTAPGLALILAEDERMGGEGRGAAVSARVLIGAGWRVAHVPDPARLAAAWQELHRGGAVGPVGSVGPVGGQAAVPSSMPEGAS